MKSHVYRPFMVIAAAVGLILVARAFMVPEDFGAQETGYMYGWHRKSNEQQWKDVKVKFKGREYCKDCHSEQYDLIATTPHVMINCENCHGPALDHPQQPAKLDKNTDRALCLRCHAALPYKGSGRMNVRGIEDDKHNPGAKCVDCHNPHKPGFN